MALRTAWHQAALEAHSSFVSLDASVSILDGSADAETADHREPRVAGQLLLPLSGADLSQQGLYQIINRQPATATGPRLR
jgi:hypothetical protein